MSAEKIGQNYLMFLYVTFRSTEIFHLKDGIVEMTVLLKRGTVL